MCGVWLENFGQWECNVCHEMNSNLLQKTYNWICKGLTGKQVEKTKPKSSGNQIEMLMGVNGK